jgi:hypothetical protein
MEELVPKLLDLKSFLLAQRTHDAEQGNCPDKRTRARATFMSTDVDEGIAGLILACWRADIETALSCEKARAGRVDRVTLSREYEYFLDLAIPQRRFRSA